MTYLQRLLADGVDPGTAEVMDGIREQGHCPGCYLGDSGLPAHTCAMGQAALELPPPTNEYTLPDTFTNTYTHEELDR
jgi:hypothetical protein